MIDLLLNDTGDIDFKLINKNPGCNIQFFISNNKVQKISFITGISRYSTLVKDEDQNKKQYIKFYLKNKNNYKLSSDAAIDVEEKLQAIRLRLETELNDTVDGIIDTNFYLNRHTIINGLDSLSRINDNVSKIIEEIFPEAQYEVVFEEGTGYFYCSTIKIKIYYNDELIKTFTI